PMPQDIRSDAFHILRSDVTAPVQERVGAAAESEIDRRSRGCAVTNQSFQRQIIRSSLARGPDNVDNVIFDPVVDVNLVHYVARGDDLLWIDHALNAQVRR